MKYYKNENDEIWAYEDNVPEFGQGDKDQLTVKEGLISITEEEAQAILSEINKPTLEDMVANNEAIIKPLTQEATLKIDIFQDSIDLDMAEEGAEDKLKLWRKYRVLLSQVDTGSEDMELPEKPI